MTDKNTWGQHLLLDISGCNENVCSKDAIADFVRNLVIEIDMRSFGDPIIEHFAVHDYDAVGYSLVQLIETSTITGHFSDNNRDAYLDIFSCKRFSKDKVIEVVDKYFAPKTVRAAFLSRGVKLPTQAPFEDYPNTK